MMKNLLTKTIGAIAGATSVALVLVGATGLAAAADYNWRLEVNLGEGQPGYDSIKESFAKNVFEMSNGRMKIDVFPINALFPVTEGLEAIGGGVAEMGVMAGGFYAGKMGPIAAIESGIPGAERDPMERFAFFYKKGFIDIVREAYAEHNVYYLAPHIAPPFGITSKVPIHSAKDFEGLKIRAHGAEAEWFKSMGASPVMIGGSEVYTALATGVIDAVRWAGPSINLPMGFHEVAKYYVQPSTMPAPNNNFLVNKAAWDSLPADLQGILEQSAKVASIDYLMRVKTLDAAAMAEMEKSGFEISRIPDDEWAEMEKGAREVWAQYAEKDERSARAIKMLQDYLTELGR